jgi:hypothetical protein
MTLYLHSQDIWPHSQYRTVCIQCQWKPPHHPYLHYDEFYRGIYEYLREPPSFDHKIAACEYLESLRTNFVMFPEMPALVRVSVEHRIRWILEWLKYLPDDCLSDAETTVGD